MTLNNHGTLNKTNKDYERATTYQEEAMQLRRFLAAKYHPKQYNPALASSLSNLGIRYGGMQKYDMAEKCYTEALGILRKLAENNPRAYNPDLATTLNNLGGLYVSKPEPEYGKAEECGNECLDIRRALAAEQPQVYNPNLARILVNMSMFYQNHRPNKERSIRLAKEALEILDQCHNESAQVREDREKAKYIMRSDLN